MGRFVLLLCLPLLVIPGCGGGQKEAASASAASQPSSAPMDEDAPNPCAASPDVGSQTDEDAPPSDEDAPNPCAGG